MRGTSHNGRVGKNGTYSAKHNDRNFDLDNASHIDRTKTNGNWYWHRYQSEASGMTFEEVENKFYDDHFTRSLDAKNERYRASGHKERMKSMNDYRQNKLSCPEETLLQVGKTGETIDPDLLKRICIEHINWEMRTFPNVKVLDAALHVDEEGAPHMHERKVWVAHSADGLIVGQSKALEEMGIERPHPEKKRDRYNNPKTTYTAMCREHFLQVCKKYNLKIELEPDRVSKRGLELEEYKRLQEQEKAEVARREVERAQQERKKVEKEKRKLEKRIQRLKTKNQVLEAENGELKYENEGLKRINREGWNEKSQLDLINVELEIANNRLRRKNRELKQDLGEADRMREFMSHYTIKGKSLDILFDEQQVIEQQKIKEEFEARNENEWDLEL